MLCKSLPLKPWLYLLAILLLPVFFVSFFRVLFRKDRQCCHETAHDLTKSDAWNTSSSDLSLHVAALVLARGGSKGIPLKNLARIANVTLLARALHTINRIPGFSSVWVSTDHAAIAEEARGAGARVHRRSEASATDTAPSILGAQDFLSAHPEVDVVALVQCTSPFLTSAYLGRALRMVRAGSYDSVFAVSRTHDLRWTLRPDGTVEALNFDPKKRPRRQDWEGELVENGMFYFAKIGLIKQGLFQGGRSGVVVVPKNYSLEINTKSDLRIAQLLLERHLFM